MFAKVFKNLTISKDLYDSIDEINQKLLIELVEQIKNEIEMMTRKREMNPTFIDRHGVRTTIKMGEYVKDKTPLDTLVKSIDKLATNYNKDISTKILKSCLTEVKCTWKTVIKIVDYAASQELINVCKLIYQTLGADALIHPDRYGWTALHRAAKKNNAKAANILINTIDDDEVWEYINILGHNMHESPLFVASTRGGYDVAKILLTAAKDKACEYIMTDDNDRHYSLFDSACMNGHLDIVKLLVETVAQENIWSLIHLHNQNAFISACGNGKDDVVKFLLEIVGDRKMELMKERNYKMSGLDYASFNGHINVVKVIIEQAGDKINQLRLDKAIGCTLVNNNIEISKYLSTFV
jgi:hypothetical protein